MHSGPVSAMVSFSRHPEVREHFRIAADSDGEINDLEAMDKWGVALLYKPIRKPSLDLPPTGKELNPAALLMVAVIHSGFLQLNPSPRQLSGL